MYKVVVVEDESRVRKGIITSVNWYSIDCMVMGEAEDGNTGMDIIRKINPDIVITDICMPKLTGIEMIEKLQAEGISPKVIFLTAYNEFSYAQKAVKLKACDYVLKPFNDGEIEECISKILFDSKNINEIVTSKEELQLKKGDKSKYLADAIKFIEENYSNPELSVEMVANSLGISGGHLSHLFRKETNLTMNNYVIDCRMREAKKLLKDYSHKIYEVAEKVGYRDITYFSATFKKNVGVSPSEYQDRYRG